MKLQTFLFLFLCAVPLFADCVSGSSVPEEGLVAYYPFDGDAVSHGSVAGVDGEVYRATLATDRFGEPNSAYHFGGSDSAYIEIPDSDVFSIITTGALTISAWISPDSLDFERTDGGYVHWMGKGEPQAHEWALRMYNFHSERPNRISSYAFNLSGGLGAGSYVQEEVVPGEWIHIVARYDMESNTITIFRNGEQKDQDPLFDDTYKVIPENGNAPVRIGTRSLWSFFPGKNRRCAFLRPGYFRRGSSCALPGMPRRGDGFAFEKKVFGLANPLGDCRSRWKGLRDNRRFLGFRIFAERSKGAVRSVSVIAAV